VKTENLSEKTTKTLLDWQKNDFFPAVRAILKYNRKVNNTMQGL